MFILQLTSDIPKINKPKIIHSFSGNLLQFVRLQQLLIHYYFPIINKYCMQIYPVTVTFTELYKHEYSLLFPKYVLYGFI
jgi:hypothetical protein